MILAQTTGWPTASPAASLQSAPLPALLLACLLAGTVLGAVGCGRRGGPAAEMVLTGGAVVTLDAAHPEAQAVAIRAGRIAAVGTDAEILALAGPATRRIDLRGAMVLPGLTDAHGHVRALGEEIDNLDVRGAASVEAITRRVRERAARLPAGAWITGGGWDQTKWPGKAFPDHRPLSAAAPDRPVWLSRIDGHAGWANRKAMEIAGVGRATPDPEGGRIVRDAHGAPTGIFIDNATDLIEKARPAPTREQIKGWIRLALERCAAAGLTEVHDAGIDEEEVAAFRELADAGALPLRVYLMWSGMNGRFFPAQGDRVSPLQRALQDPPLINYRNRLTLRAVKLMIDGAMGSRGAVFFQDYADDPGNRGLFVMRPEEIEQATELGLRHGYQVCTHAIGDRGIHLTLEAYEQALRAVRAAPPADPEAAAQLRDPRLRIEHLQCVARDDIPLLARLGVIASMQPSHATSDMDWADDRVGIERGRGLYAWRWVLDAGVPIAAGSDFPVDPERPLIGIHSGVTRQDLENRPEGGWHPEQRMTLDEVLRAYTQGAAYAAFEEKEKGRIAPGMWADLTVLRQDLRAIPAERIAADPVAWTIVGGTIAYQAP
jgi:predicted amidohydrolase YtcJ